MSPEKCEWASKMQYVQVSKHKARHTHYKKNQIKKKQGCVLKIACSLPQAQKEKYYINCRLQRLSRAATCKVRKEGRAFFFSFHRKRWGKLKGCTLAYY